MTATDAALGIVLALLNIALAWLVLQARPLRVPHWLIAGWLLTNAIGAQPQRPAALEEAFALVGWATVFPLAILPFVFPRRVLPRPAELALVAFAAVPFLVQLAIATDAITPSLGIVAEVFRIPTFLGVFLLLDAYLSARTSTARHEARYLLAAYAMTVVTLHASAPPPATGPVWLVAAQQTIITTRPFVLVLTLGAIAIAFASSRIRGAARDRPLREDVFVIGFGLLGFAPAVLDFNGSITWLLIRPILLAIGLLHFRLLDVEARSTLRLRGAVVAFASAGLFLFAARTVQPYTTDPALVVGVALLASLALGVVLLGPILRSLSAVLARGAHAPPARDPQRVALDHAIMQKELFLDRYRVERVLGEGGFGRALLAHDERLHRSVVLKVARYDAPEEKDRALREARVLARLDHPNIVRIHDVEEVGEETLLVLEHAPGGSLADRLQRGPLGPAECATLANDLLAALDAAHAAGVVHRDVKPANVLLTRDGRAKLADFGVARARQSEGVTMTGATAAGTVGTLRYLSPEQARGLRADERSDLYAVGAVLYEAFAGEAPIGFDGLTDFEARLAIVDDAPRLPLAGAPAWLNDLLAQLLAKDPAARPQSARAAQAGVPQDAVHRPSSMMPDVPPTAFTRSHDKR